MADPTPAPDHRPNGPPTGPRPGRVEITVSQDGKVLHQFRADEFLMFDDEAVTDPAELAKFRQPPS